MLVLSRRRNDKVVFPNLGITIHVVRLQGKTVRLGIEAPEDVSVLRHELGGEDDRLSRPSRSALGASHAIRNRLNAATIGLHLLRRQLQTGQRASIEPTMNKILQELESLETALTQPATRTTTAPAQRLRALLVEDNENELELLSGYLRSFNFDVATARDGVDALERLAKEKAPDFVLLDLNMPRLDGQGTIARIRSNPAHVGLKVFVVSGTPHAASGNHPCGADRWFQKPIRPDHLVREISRELSQPCVPA